jgi:glycerol-3-phosphate dehydrogenase
MPRNVSDLAGGRVDLLVIGGGIHGLFAAADAAGRGLSVILVERGDFGGGLSFNHQRTIHGGLRALQSGHIGRVREQIRERRTWAQIAPHLVRPLPFLIGSYRWTKRSRLFLRMGFAAYDFIGRRRNVGVSAELHLPKARLESAATTRRLSLGVAEPGLSGGAIWYDYQTRHPDRLNWTVVRAARQAGARVMNYVEAIGPLKADGRLCGARVRDVLTGQEVELEAACTLLAPGAGLGPLMTAFGVNGAPPLLRAMNMLLDRPARDIAAVAPSPNGRMFTAVPWRGFLLVGTHQSDEVVEASETTAPAEAVDAFLADVNGAFPPVRATRADIRMLHYGLTPAHVRNGSADLLPEPRVMRHASEGSPGLVSLVGVKYTTSRLAAERAVDAIVVDLHGKRRGPSRTARTVLPYAGIADVEGRLTETLRTLGLSLDLDVVQHLSDWYGTEASAVVTMAAERGLLDRISTESPVLAGEIAYAAEESMAERLSDATLRRTPLGSAGHPGPAALERAADVMAGIAGWSAERRQREILDAGAIYDRWPRPRI